MVIDFHGDSWNPIGPHGPIDWCGGGMPHITHSINYNTTKYTTIFCSNANENQWDPMGLRWEPITDYNVPWGQHDSWYIHVIMRCIVTCQRSITLLTAPVCGGCLVATINYMRLLLCCDKCVCTKRWSCKGLPSEYAVCNWGRLVWPPQAERNSVLESICYNLFDNAPCEARTQLTAWYMAAAHALMRRYSCWWYTYVIEKGCSVCWAARPQKTFIHETTWSQWLLGSPSQDHPGSPGSFLRAYETVPMLMIHLCNWERLQRLLGSPSHERFYVRRHGRSGCWAALHRTTLEIARILFTRLCLQSSQMS